MSRTPMLGLMLDCSRNAVFTPEAVRRLIDLLSKMGYNTLQLYTEDTYEVDGEPFFGYLRGRYTKDELRALDAYAASRGIELQPCIQTLAHLNAIFRWEVYKPINDQADTLLVGEERTYELIDRMFASCAECFTSRRIHIGFDEAFALGRGKYLDKYGKKSHAEIMMPHLARVCELAEKYGFRPMAWGDMFFREAANGGWYGSRLICPEKIAEKIPENLDIVYWDYYHENEASYRLMLDGFTKFRPAEELIFAGGVWSWTSMVPHNDYSISTTRAALNVCAEVGVRDILMTLWGNDGGECSAFSLLPSLFYTAEHARGNTDMVAIKEKFLATFGIEFDDMMALDLPDAIGKAAYGNRNASKHGLYNDPFLGIMDGTLYEGGTAHFRRSAKKLRAIAKKGGEFAYLFDTEAKLCSLLEVKYELGVRLRAAYKANDREGLTVALTDLKRARRRLEIFAAAYADAWEREKKPQGYELQDVRLGGMLHRLDSCIKKLSEYLDGKRAEIPELCEDILRLPSIARDWWQINTPSIIYTY